MNNSISQWITAYLLWMIDQGYSSYTLDDHERMLRRFEGYVAQKGVPSHQAFSADFLQEFFGDCCLVRARWAMNGFLRYLDQKGLVVFQGSASYELPPLFKAYLHYHQRTREVTHKSQMNIRNVLRELNAFIQRQRILIEDVGIEDVDGFLRETGRNLAPRTCQDKRGIVRGFLRYLHHEKRLFKKDLSAQLKSAPVFNRENPPKYLRPEELVRLFESPASFSPYDLRAHAMARLAYSTGLRPSEIAAISLDDISFTGAELRVPLRKGYNPTLFPLPEDTIKAMAAYIIGARPQSGHRALFLGLEPPYPPVSSPTVQRSIAQLMDRASVPGTPYWLRHTYAQNLLQSGASIFEIKEMLGHDSVKTTKRYLHVDLRLMREVLLDD